MDSEKNTPAETEPTSEAEHRGEIETAVTAPPENLPPENAPPAKQTRTEPFAIVGFILSLFSIPLISIACGVLGVVFSSIGRSRARKNGTGGRKLGTAGLILSIIGLCLSAVVLVIAIVMLVQTVTRYTTSIDYIYSLEVEDEALAALTIDIGEMQHDSDGFSGMYELSFADAGSDVTCVYELESITADGVVCEGEFDSFFINYVAEDGVSRGSFSAAAEDADELVFTLAAHDMDNNDLGTITITIYPEEE